MKQADSIELTVPARPECLLIIRLTMAAVAERMGFTLDQLEDAKVAVAESCLWLMGTEKPATLKIQMNAQQPRLLVTVYAEALNQGEGAQEMGEHSLLLVHAMADDVVEHRNAGGRMTAIAFSLPGEG